MFIGRNSLCNCHNLINFSKNKNFQVKREAGINLPAMPASGEHADIL